MKRIIFALLAVLLVPSLYALNAGPSDLRIGDFKCRYDRKSVYLGGYVEVAYDCFSKEKDMLKLSILYYGKKENKEEQRQQFLNGYAERDLGQAKTVRFDSVEDERGVALYKITSINADEGTLLLARFDDDKQVVLEGYLWMTTLQKLVSNKKAEEMLKTILTLDVPDVPL